MVLSSCKLWSSRDTGTRAKRSIRILWGQQLLTSKTNLEGNNFSCMHPWINLIYPIAIAFCGTSQVLSTTWRNHISLFHSHRNKDSMKLFILLKTVLQLYKGIIYFREKIFIWRNKIQQNMTIAKIIYRTRLSDSTDITWFSHCFAMLVASW